MNAVVTTTDKPAKVSLVARMAERFGVDPDKMLVTLKATAFKGDVSNEQMMALLIVAEQYKLNPWTKEIYAFPDRNNGIVPVVGVDGWSRIINEHPQFDGMEFKEADDGAWVECVIYRKDRSHATSIREWMSECKRDVGPWKTHPRRMLRHKAMIQCARMAFGFGGIFDQDEAERIVTPTSVQTVITSKPQPIKPEGFDKQLADLEAVADEGMEVLLSVWEKLPLDFRTYLTSTDTPKWESIKAKAETK